MPPPIKRSLLGLSVCYLLLLILCDDSIVSVGLFILLDPANHHPGLLLSWNELVDVSVDLQPLLHGDEQFDPVDHQLGHFHLAQAKGHRVAHKTQHRGFWEEKKVSLNKVRSNCMKRERSTLQVSPQKVVPVCKDG